eukprot:scaffold58160_cov23-Tisochrysis_lutea.AAC.1
MKVMAPTATAFKKPTTPVAGGREGPKPPARPSPSSASSCLASGGSPNLESKHTQRVSPKMPGEHTHTQRGSPEAGKHLYSLGPLKPGEHTHSECV